MMNISPINQALAAKNINTSELIAQLQRSLDRAYQKVREAARARWEAKQLRYTDPSDACVSVRIAVVPPSAARLRVR